MRVKCLSQEHNTMTRPGLEPGTLYPESSALTTRPPRLPQDSYNLHLTKRLHVREKFRLHSSSSSFAILVNIPYIHIYTCLFKFINKFENEVIY